MRSLRKLAVRTTADILTAGKHQGIVTLGSTKHLSQQETWKHLNMEVEKKEASELR